MEKGEIVKKENIILYLVITFVFLIIALSITTTTMNIIETKYIKNEKVYEQCVNICGAKHFKGARIGTESSDNLYVNEFDRTNCINNCNDMYLLLTNKISIDNVIETKTSFEPVCDLQ